MPIPDFDFARNDERADNIFHQNTLNNYNDPEANPFLVSDNLGTGDENNPALSDYKTRQGNYPAETPVATQEPTNPYTEQIQSIDELILKDLPKPEYDANREKRLQTMAVGNTIGKALATLGDAFAVSQKGIIPVRQNESSPYVAQILQDQNKFKDQMDQYQYQNFMNKMNLALKKGELGTQAGVFDYQKGRAEKADEFQQQQLDMQKEYNDWRMKQGLADTKENQARWLAEFGLSKRRVALGEREQDFREQKAIMDATLKDAAQRLKKVGSGYELKSSDGKLTVPIKTNGELQKIYALIFEDKDPALQKDVDYMLNKIKSMEGVGTKEAQQVIVSKFWERSQNALNYLKGSGYLTEQGSENKETKPQGEFKFPGLN